MGSAGRNNRSQPLSGAGVDPGGFSAESAAAAAGAGTSYGPLAVAGEGDRDGWLGVGVVARVVAAVVVEPSLWPTALRQGRRLARPGWWHRRPYLPLPDRDYVRFRLQTAYGDGPGRPEPEDVVTWLRWCARMRTIATG